MNWRKVLRWVASRPLGRARRKIAARQVTYTRRDDDWKLAAGARQDAAPAPPGVIGTYMGINFVAETPARVVAGPGNLDPHETITSGRTTPYPTASRALTPRETRMDPPTPSNSHFDYLGVAWCDRCGRRQEMHWHESTQEQVCGGCGRAVVPKNGRLTTAEQAALRAFRDAYCQCAGVNLDARRDLGP